MLLLLRIYLVATTAVFVVVAINAAFSRRRRRTHARNPGMLLRPLQNREAAAELLLCEVAPDEPSSVSDGRAVVWAGVALLFAGAGVATFGQLVLAGASAVLGIVLIVAGYTPSWASSRFQATGDASRNRQVVHTFPVRHAKANVLAFLIATRTWACTWTRVL